MKTVASQVLFVFEVFTQCCSLRARVTTFLRDEELAQKRVLASLSSFFLYFLSFSSSHSKCLVNNLVGLATHLQVVTAASLVLERARANPLHFLQLHHHLNLHHPMKRDLLRLHLRNHRLEQYLWHRALLPLIRSNFRNLELKLDLQRRKSLELNNSWKKCTEQLLDLYTHSSTWTRRNETSWKLRWKESATRKLSENGGPQSELFFLFLHKSYAHRSNTRLDNGQRERNQSLQNPKRNLLSLSKLRRSLRNLSAPTSKEAPRTLSLLRKRLQYQNPSLVLPSRRRRK